MEDFFNPKKDNEEEYNESLLSQYNIFLNMIDSLTTRRSSVNTFFLSVNTGLLALMGVLTNFGIIQTQFTNVLIIAGCLAGVIFAYAWRRTIRSYTQLSKVNWDLVWEIEKKLPLNLHKKEWELLGEGKDASKYKKLTDVEKGIPVIFIIIYLILISILIYIVFVNVDIDEGKFGINSSNVSTVEVIHTFIFKR